MPSYYLRGSCSGGIVVNLRETGYCGIKSVILVNHGEVFFSTKDTKAIDLRRQVGLLAQPLAVRRRTAGVGVLSSLAKQGVFD